MDYEDIPQILERDNPSEVLRVPIMVSMYDDDQEFCEEICLKLSKHEHYQVRANAILGFGHIARRFQCLLSDNILDIVNDALSDESEEVRGQADSDILCYLAIKIPNFNHT